MRSCLPLVVLLVPQLSAAAANRVPVSKLLDQMIRRSTLAEPGGTPFYLKAPITDKDDAKSEFNGTLEEYWPSPTKWRRVVKLRDFSQGDCPIFESFLVSQGIILLKYWLEVSEKEQHKRFLARIEDPSKRWKLSPMDLESHRRWYDYSRTRDVMLAATDTAASPWYIVPSDDKKRARLNCIAHILSSIPWEEIPYTPPKLPPILATATVAIAVDQYSGVC